MNYRKMEEEVWEKGAKAKKEKEGLVICLRN